MASEDNDTYEVQRRANSVSHNAGSGGGSSIFGIIIIGVIIWFFFFRTDYSKPWIKENNEEYATVVWCKNGNCLSSEHVYSLSVYNEGKAAYGDDRYILAIDMPNGGEVEVNVYCAKNEDKLVSHERYCEGVSDDGEIWRFYPKK